MRLLFIRHGEPDYSIDSLTEKGWREALLLSEKMAKEEVSAVYVSPLGRAKDTASLTLEKTGWTAREREWLKEFPIRMKKPYGEQINPIAWDWLPEEWTKQEKFYSAHSWYDAEEFAGTGTKEEYLRVTAAFDALLAEHGYVRDGRLYRAVHSNRDTLVFFCHFGIIGVLLGHLMHVSPMVLWHHTVLAPTSVTTLYTEERREGVAQFRAVSIGDISHLYAAGEEPSFAARFCETFDGEERHD